MTRRATVTFAGAAVIFAIAGCDRASAPHPSPSTPATSSSTSTSAFPSASPYPRISTTARPKVPIAAPASVNQADPSAVALAGTKALYQYDTVVDADPNATAVRAAAWLTPAFATQVRGYPPTAAPGAQWNGWAKHHAYLVVTVAAGQEDHPIDTPDRAFRQVVVTLAPMGRDGWTGPRVTAVVYVGLQLIPGQGWRIASSATN